MNSTSTASLLHRPELVADGLMLRVDISALRWDKFFRASELQWLEQTGVQFKFRDEATRLRFLDIWDAIAAADPFFPSQYDPRPWVNPMVLKAACALSGSAKPVVAAQFLFSRLLLEAQDGGYYSLLLLLPPNERDLYKRFGQDIATIERFGQLRHGGAVVGPSVVAIHNRELQEIPNDFGYDYKFIWRTFDFAKDADDPRRNVFRALGGTAQHDGREIIGTLPNGLHWYYLANAAGGQVNVVPQNIAVDQRDARGIVDPNVTNAIKCIDCHAGTRGIWPFQDRVKVAALRQEIALAIIYHGGKIEERFVPVLPPPNPLAPDVFQQTLKRANGDGYSLQAPRLKLQVPSPVSDAVRAKVTVRAQDLEEYYLRDLSEHIAAQQVSYSGRVVACNGLSPGINANAVVTAYNETHIDLVTPEQAAIEQGLSLEQARTLWRAPSSDGYYVTGNPDLVILSSGQPIRRAAWEKVFVDAAHADHYSWDSNAGKQTDKRGP